MNLWFDWAATAPASKDYLTRALEASVEYQGNPSSQHKDGKEALAFLEQMRAKCAQSLSVAKNAIIFTSGGTEANHLPLLALIQRPVRGTIAISAIEHASIREMAKMLDHTGWKTLVIPADERGMITTEAVLGTIQDDTAFVAVMAVNNETGAVQNIGEIGLALKEACKGKKKPHFHVDGVQAPDKASYWTTDHAIDSFALSGHKFSAPRGTGMLVLPKRVEPFIRGGPQEAGIRPGTENIGGIAALALALEANVSSFTNQSRESFDKASFLMKKIAEIPGIEPIPASRTGEDRSYSPFIFQFTNAFLPGEVLVRALSDEGINISTGSACSSKKNERPILRAMNVPPAKQQNAFRISLGYSTTMQDILQLVGALSRIIRN